MYVVTLGDAVICSSGAPGVTAVHHAPGGINKHKLTTTIISKKLLKKSLKIAKKLGIQGRGDRGRNIDRER